MNNTLRPARKRVLVGHCDVQVHSGPHVSELPDSPAKELILRIPCTLIVFAVAVSGTISAAVAAAPVNEPPKGFVALFNGKDLAGWHGMGTEDIRKLRAKSTEEQTEIRSKSLEDIRKHWTVENGELVNDGNGLYLTTDKDYRDVELWVDYKMVPKGDSGIYLRGTPQVQIWDFREEGGQWKNGADKGSGGLWNNSKGAPGKDPLVLADNPIGEWNHFRIIQVGARTTVYLNEKLVVDNAILENYFDNSNKQLAADKKTPLFPQGPIQLQTHGAEIRWRNVFVREIPPAEANEYLAKKNSGGFQSVFNGKDFQGWDGPVNNYEIVDGAIACKKGTGGTIFTKDEYGDFAARVEFKLPPGGNNGLAIRYPGSGDTAYVGMCELQVLDTEDPRYAKSDPRQAHGSAYGMAAAHRGYLRPVGEWNFEEVTVKGSTIKVELNGTVILDADLAKVTDYLDNKEHPGKDRTRGHFGFAGHGDAVQFRNVQIKRLDGTSAQ